MAKHSRYFMSGIGSEIRDFGKVTGRLIVLSGLPATGKTSFAKLPCRKLHVTYLRIDTLEQASASSLLIPSARQHWASKAA
jgi:MoxR-like ATPase